MAFLAALGQTGITFLGGSLIAFVIGHSEQKSLFWLRSPFLTFFGLISYAMYMIHLYVMSWYDTFFGPLRVGDNGAYTIRFFAILSVTIIFCLLCRYLIELPAISLRKYVLVRPRT